MKKHFSYLVIAIMSFLTIFVMSCSAVKDLGIGYTKHDMLYETFEVGDTLSYNYIRELADYGISIGKVCDTYGTVIVYNYKDTLRLITIDSNRICLYKGLKLY